MASPAVSIRLSAETYRILVTLAETERKTVTEMTRELIEQGLGKRTTLEAELLNEIRLLRTELSESASRAVKAGAGSRYFAQLATSFALDMTQYLAALAQSVRIDPNTKQEQMGQFEQKAKEFEEHFLKDPWGNL